MGNLATAYVQIVPSARGMKENLSSIFGSEMPSAGKSAGGILGSNLVSTVKKALAAAGIGEALKMALTEGAALEQSLGGIETLFKDSASTVIANAQQAYKTAGMSANSYMEQVTSFSASLLQSLGGDTTAAAEVANMALIDMSDNANKMGTSMEAIQNAYQGFAKQNYTMLDNLKLGYGGTKTEMQRLLEDAQELTGVKYDINNLSDVYNAIHAVQEELGITGTTALEASTTLTGSFNSMKAAFSDVLGNLALGNNMTASLNALADTTVTFLKDNLVPAIWNIVSALPSSLVTLINGLLPGNMEEITSTAVSQFSSFITGKLPTILKNGVNIVSKLASGFLSGIPSFLKTAGSLLNQLLAAVLAALPSMMESGFQLVQNLASGLLENLPSIISAGVSILAKLLATIASYLPQLLAQGIALVGKLAAGLIQAIPSIVSAAKNVISNAAAQFSSYDWGALGKAAVTSIASAIGSAVGSVISAAKSVASSAYSAFKSMDWGSIGSSIVSGIASGIRNGVSSIISAAKTAALSAYNSAKSALGINSPSRLFRNGIGYQIPAGEALGIRDGIPLVKRAMDSLSDSTTSSFAARLQVSGSSLASGITGNGVAGYGKVVNVTQNIYSEAKTAADLMQEARYQQELAVMLGV